VSPGATAANTSTPFPIDETTSLSTVTEADKTRWSIAWYVVSFLFREESDYLTFHVELKGLSRSHKCPKLVSEESLSYWLSNRMQLLEVWSRNELRM
jgi:hypothetical protein